MARRQSGVVRRALLWTLAGLASIAVLWLLWIAGHVWWWRSHPPRETAFMARRMEELRAVDPRAVLRYK